MKIKSGKELNYLELIKRLNKMNIKYNPEILGKKYYIDLYDKAIQSTENIEKINNEIMKDKLYKDFFNEKLRKRNEYSFEIIQSNHSNYNLSNNNMNNYNYVNKKEGFFSEFNPKYIQNSLITTACFVSVEYASNHPKNVNKLLNKIKLPFQAIKKISSFTFIQKINNTIMKMANFISELSFDKFCLMKFFILILVIVTMVLFVLKKRKKVHI